MNDRVKRGRRSAWVVWMAVVCAPAAAAAAGPPVVMGGMSKRPPVDFSDRVVKFSSLDGVALVADYYPVKVPKGERTPVAILIHMYPANRSSWKSFVPKLRDAGIAVLAYDIRGNGDSTKPAARKLAEAYKGKDPAFFQQAWMDVAGARSWIDRQDNLDPNRLVVVGASIGCSIALDYVSRTQTARAVVCLSPGTNYMGVDSLQHIRSCGSIPILLISPEGEYEAVEALAEAGGSRVKTAKYPGGREHHGTGLFEADYGAKVKKKVMKFIKKNLGIKKKADAEKKKSGKNGKKKHKKK